MLELNKRKLEKKLNALLDLLWRNGISGSEESVDFIIFLFLFKELDSHPQMKITWSKVKERTIELPVNILIKDAKIQIEQLAGHGLTGSFYLNCSMGMLLEAMDLVEDIVYCLHSNQNYAYIFDILGSTISKQQRLAVFTPLRLANTLVRMTEVHDSDILVDPACGTGNFLIASLPFTRHIRGFDNNAFSIRLTKAKLYLSGFTTSEVSYENSLESGLDYAESQASVVLTNPPFSMKINQEHLSFSIQFNTKQKQPSGILFLWRSLSLLKPGGRAAIVLPESFFFSEMYIEARKILFEMALIDGIISLPRGMFKSSAQLKTSVLLFRKKESRTVDTEYVWFYEMESSEFAQTKDHYSEEGDTFQNLLSAWFRRNQDADQWYKAKNNGHSFHSYPLKHAESKNITFASFNEIVKENYLLSVTNYSYIEPEPENFGDPQQLFSEVLDLEKQIAEELQQIIDQSRWIAEKTNQEFSDVPAEASPPSNESVLKEKKFHKFIMDMERKERKKLMNKQLKNIQSNLGWFLNELADWQIDLLNCFYKSHQPLAAHEAAKKIIGVQAALQTILLFESFGILERTLDKEINIPSYNEEEDENIVVDRQGNPLCLDRWQPAISYMEGENL
ncbi:putative type I restriction enzymeP M protein [compost metagenome]